MPTIRETLEIRERENLASYAQRVSDSVGRSYHEPQHPYRTAYQRDRARVIHSRAFRRLEGKTQVFLNGTGDHLRTRLTHTIEVASISRAIACALSLNEDLAETIALAHDLGHAPFGHSGEQILNELMADHDGFEHNVQSLRVVEIIESKYPEFPGLNLSYEVLEGLRKHQKVLRRPAGDGRDEDCFTQPCLEGQVANLADEITYYSHDIDDGLDSGLISVEQLGELEVWQRCSRVVKKQFPQLKGDLYQRYVIRILIDTEVETVVTETRRRIREAGVESPDDVRRYEEPLATYDADWRRMNLELRRFLYDHLYYHPDVNAANREGTGKVKAVFEHFLRHPEELGRQASRRLPQHGLHRTVCDYIAGMTDGFLAEEHARLMEPR